MFVEVSFSIYLLIYFRELKPARLNGSKSIESHAILFKLPYSFSLTRILGTCCCFVCDLPEKHIDLEQL